VGRRGKKREGREGKKDLTRTPINLLKEALNERERKSLGTDREKGECGQRK